MAKEETDMTGIITDIQKFSLHDGKGIRTTVFFKGCNMRCDWCHNPETISPKPQRAFYERKCIHCGHCDHCPTGARVTIGREKTVEEVYRELAADLPYYQASDGGVTLSGGEPLMQAEFARELLIRCKENGIGTAIETNLSLPFERMKGLLPYLDKVFFDIKLMDDAKHRQATGISNATVLENAQKLASSGMPAVVRTPLIPGVTDTAENIGAISAFVYTLPNVRYYELLNFNPLGEEKYRALGQSCVHEGKRPLKKDALLALAQAAQESGVRVVYGQE